MGVAGNGTRLVLSARRHGASNASGLARLAIFLWNFSLPSSDAFRWQVGSTLRNLRPKTFTGSRPVVRASSTGRIHVRMYGTQPI